MLGSGPGGEPAGKRLRSCAVLPGPESAGAAAAPVACYACAARWRVSGVASCGRGRLALSPLRTRVGRMESLDELDLLLLEEDGGAEAAPRVEL